MKITILGSGTSSGIPVIGCECSICTSTSKYNKRLRASALIEVSIDNVTRHILIDSGPDFREQALRFKIPKIDAVLYTHSHADHIFGLDDLRIYNFKQKEDIHVYADTATGTDLKRIFNYTFTKDPEYEGGGIPSLILHNISEGQGFHISKDINKSVPITPIEIFHGKRKITGYRIYDFAYLTDCSGIPDYSLKYLDDVKTIVISGLRHKPHQTHFTINGAIQFVQSLNVTNAYLTHIAHEVDHEEVSNMLSQKNIDGKNIKLAYDGLEIIT